MIDVFVWMDSFMKALRDVFGDRVWFVGLQGSYARGEATETSDIDTVVILDKLSSADIQRYNTVLDTLAYRDLLCGFLSGKDELFRWDPSDLFQFYNDTRPLYGSLDELLSRIDGAAVDRAILRGMCNIYHGCVHNMLYEKSVRVLRGLYKSASFVVQAIVFKETGKYVSCLNELLTVASAEERKIVKTFLELKNGVAVQFDTMSEALFEWAKGRI